MLPPQPSPAPDSPEFSPLAIGEDLTPLPAYKAAGTTEIGFDGLLAEPLRLREDLASGCGGQTWPAGMVLGRHMLRYHREDLGEARILELGAGGGLVGLAVARGCAVGKHPLLVTDQLEMHSLMEHNIALNNLEGKVQAAILNWGEPLPPAVVALKPNVILAADCVYFEPAFPLLLATLSDLLALCPEATIYFCFKKRRRADMQFLKKAQKKFKVAEIADGERPVFSREGLFLYTFQASP
ncbi:putative methyltransferase-domain-containing protein [Annulohypoxylon truncatum]|uniref:putative methyltransferase-domain-containing protein n=1 Tax=Annulohypoxylon truncatum TaxID=327061 RepID=UPI0020088947|nr:putative methyltransferase-domain-containing protein [Annulohypoxylon truncatum]KAI1207177.1 putative methyltransferase-domain-containing protein [Annulohypoxylon truncatum]